MKLLTKEMEARFAELGDQDTPDAIVVAKFFDPVGSWTWYVTAYYPEDRLFFGLVKGLETELGYFSLDELEAIKRPFGLGIERDLYFKETPLPEIRAKLAEVGHA